MSGDRSDGRLCLLRSTQRRAQNKMPSFHRSEYSDGRKFKSRSASNRCGRTAVSLWLTNPLLPHGLSSFSLVPDSYSRLTEEANEQF
jgi:hypothetical protein